MHLISNFSVKGRMKIPFSIFLLCSTLSLQAQDDVIAIDGVKLADGSMALIANNLGHGPYTVWIDCELKNLNPSMPLPMTVVIQPNSPDTILTLTPNGTGDYGYRYSSKYFLGDSKSVHDAEHVYTLPFEKNQNIKVSQGNNGTRTHTGHFALDFEMDEGTQITAARKGIVAKIKEDSNTGCPAAKCKNQGNYVMIVHDDGTIGSYFHLKKNGSLVELGQAVNPGDAIALSGNTGWSSDPHLHFEVFVQNFEGKTTVPTKFLTSTGILDELKESTYYNRELE